MDIDTGSVLFDLSGFLGGFASQGDNAVFTATFKDAGGSILGVFSIGPVTTANRGNTTGLLSHSTSGSIAIGVRTVELDLQMTRLEGAFNDGYADNLSLILTNTSSPAPITMTLDHFKCYKAKEDAVDVVVDLQDQFGTEPDVLIGKPKRFCTPVGKNGEGISHPMAHLTCYKIKGSEEAREVVIENQFGRQVFEIGKTKTLCVPSEQLDVILKEEDSDEN